jgi:hypothetical protein
MKPEKYSYSRGSDRYFYFWNILKYNHTIKDYIVIGQLYLKEPEVKAIILDMNIACEHNWHDGDPWGRGNSDSYVCGECGASIRKTELDVPEKIVEKLVFPITEVKDDK